MQFFLNKLIDLWITLQNLLQNIQNADDNFKYSIKAVASVN